MRPRILGSALFALSALASLGAQTPHRHANGLQHAHASPGPLRLWSNATTGESMRGALLATREESVSIERENGNVVVLALADLTDADRAEVERHRAAIVARNSAVVAGPQSRPQSGPTQRLPFDAFAPAVKTRWDERWLYVESDGLPHAPLAHTPMVGIASWQQQVPLPQAYTGSNAWQIPLHPTLAATPISAKTQLYRGAIALAANGVPIFNALNNRGEDTLLAGELDEFGGHAGRADDYHYHVAPLSLEKVVGKGQPIAYALDGFPILGLFDPAARKGDEKACPLGATAKLDELGGHTATSGPASYHYHASTSYPYLNGGMRGTVTVVDDQIEPQPRVRLVRPWLQPLRGARITGFTTVGPKSWSLEYHVGTARHLVNFRCEDSGAVVFEFVGPDGKKTVSNYGGRSQQEPRPRRGEGQPKGPAQGQDGPRAPWLIAHARELDTNGDGKVTHDELLAQARETFAAYDRDQDGVLAPEEYDREHGARPPRLPMAGFVQVHAKELDPDGDGKITRAEFLATVERMFAKSDHDGDGTLSGTELDPAARPESAPQQRGGRGALARLTEFKTDVPAHPFDVVLVRPTATSITVSVVAYADGEGQVEFGESATALTKRTPLRAWKRMEPVAFVLDGLRPDAGYAYRLRWRAGQGEFAQSDVQSFHTQRAAGANFVFTIQADSHLDTNVDPAVYARTLANAREEHPDFHVDLGDTFMTDKRREFRTTEPQYFAQRWYLGQLCSTTPLFMALGNHDGEYGYGGQDGMAAWSHALRTRLFPPPEIDAKAPRTYTGRTEWRDGAGGNWYAFTWGDALCVVLDPFSMTRERPRGGGGPEAEFVNTDQNWTRTLGREQYEWLAATLAASKARFKFVFLHHLVGGFGRAARGGVEAAPFFEWGGKNADGSDGFAQHRPGWAKPIHALLVEHGVTAVFHGHDHLYVHAELDGVTYQCVPQPGNARGGTRSAGEYGYLQGTILGSPGHLRVGVSASEAKVAYVHATTGGDGKNGSVVAEYSLTPRRKP